MLSNFFWAVKRLGQSSPMAIIILLVLVLVNVGMQYLEIRLPALVAGEVILGQGMRHALPAVGILLSALMLGELIQKTFTYIQKQMIEGYRYKTEELFTKKSLHMYYQTFERKEVRDLGGRAYLATGMWNGLAPLEDIVKGGFGIAENLLGYLLFGAVISFASPWLVLLLTVGPLVNLWAVRTYQKWEYGHRSKMTDLNRKLEYINSLPGDFAGAKDIRVYSMASWLRDCYRELSAERGKWDKKTVKYSFLSRMADLLVILLRDGISYALLIAMVLGGEITVEEFILYFAAISSFAGWVSGVIDCWNRMNESSLRICDLREYIDYPEPDEKGTVKARDHLLETPEIVFDRVCFRYDGAKKDAIHDLSLTIRKGEKLALVGDNGAGKTTLVKLLCGLYTPTSGEIRYNGIPLSDFDREDYYRLVAPVFQDIRTGFFSLGEIVSGKAMEETDIARAKDCICRAGLSEKLAELPEGIHTKLGKQVNREGTELSGGEAQKLMLARALYKDAPLLLLDEPTAALDPIAESRIYREYQRMTESKTSLFISHRLASTAFCDRIILLKEGEICEEGTHEELIEAGGIYRELFNIQSCWYQEERKEAAGV